MRRRLRLIRRGPSAHHRLSGHSASDTRERVGARPRARRGLRDAHGVAGGLGQHLQGVGQHLHHGPLPIASCMRPFAPHADAGCDPRKLRHVHLQRGDVRVGEGKHLRGERGGRRRVDHQVGEGVAAPHLHALHSLLELRVHGAAIQGGIGAGQRDGCHPNHCGLGGASEPDRPGTGGQLLHLCRAHGTRAQGTPLSSREVLLEVRCMLHLPTRLCGGAGGDEAAHRLPQLALLGGRPGPLVHGLGELRGLLHTDALQHAEACCHG